MLSNLLSDNSQRRLETVVIDGSTIEELISELTPNFIRYASRFGLEDMTDDLIQDVYLAMVNASERQAIRDPRAFLFTILINKVKEYCRTRKNENKLLCSLDSVYLECHKAAQDNPFLTQELEEANQERINRLLELMEIHLPPHAKRVLELKFFEKKSYKEISDLTGKSEVSIRQTASRSERKLKLLM